MSFVVKEADVVRLVMGYLKGNGCYEAHNALALETETSFDNLPSSLLYLQRLVYQGRWHVVLKYLDTLKKEITAPEILSKLEYFVHRQKYLELLSWQGGGEQRMAFPPWKPNTALETASMDSCGKIENEVESNIEMSILVKELNTLKTLCSAAEFNALCAFLTLERLESHPDYHHWTVAQGRWTCFSELSRILTPILAADDVDSTQLLPLETNDTRQGLLKTIAMSLAYQTALALDKPFSDSNHEQTAEFNHSLGYISSVCDPSGEDNGRFDDKSTPLLVVQSPLQVRQRFDTAAALPRVDPEKVDTLHRLATSSAQSKDSPARMAAVQRTVPSPPRTDTEHHLKVSAAAALPPYVPAGMTEMPQQYVQHSDMYQNNMPQAFVAPAGAVPGPGGYMYVLPPGYPQNPNVFGVMPAGGVPGSFVPQMMHQMVGQQGVSQQNMPFPLPMPVPGPQPQTAVQDQRLSIDVGEGHPAGQAWNRPQSAQQQVQQQPRRSLGTPNVNAPPSQSARPSASSSARNPPANYDQAPVDPFTPQAVALPGNYFQPQSAYPYNPMGQQGPPGQPSDYQQGYPGPQSVTHVSPYVTQPQPSHVNVAVRTEPTDAHPHGKVPAWTAGQEGPASSSARSNVTPGVHRPNTEVVVASPAAFTVPILDEAKVKQMPAALRRKMEADKEAAALAAEERQQESLQAERAASRGRSRSAPRGNAAAVPVTIVTPASSSAGRPQSAVRGRGNNAAAENQPSAPSVVRNGNSAAVDVRKSSETAISKFSQQSQPSQGGGGSVRSGGGASRIPIAAPLSVQSKDVPSSAGQRHRDAAPALPAEKVNYSAHVVYESKCPLRCVSVLGGGPARTQFAVGSNAKAIIAMSYARGEIEAQRDVQASVVIDRELAGVHSGSVYCMDYHAGLGLIASGSNDKAIRFCSPTTGQCGEAMKEHTGTIRVVKFLSEHSSGSAGSALLASAGAGDCKPRLWDAQAGRFVRALSEHPDAIHGLAWVNENLFVTGCDAGVVVGHDLRSSRPAWSYNLSDALPPGEGAQKGICCLSLLGAGASPSSVPMVAGGLGGFVTIFNAATGQIFSHEKLHTDDVRSVCVSPAAARARGELSVDLLTGSYDSTAALWRVTLDGSNRVRYEGSPRVLTGHTDKVLSVVPFFAGGRSAPDVLTTGADGKVILWTL